MRQSSWTSSSWATVKTPWRQHLPGLPDLSISQCRGPSLPPFSSLYICLMNISISRAQLFPLNKQSADFIAGLLLTYLFRPLNHSQETLGKGKSGLLAMGRSCQHLSCRVWGMFYSHKPGNETPIIRRPEPDADNIRKQTNEHCVSSCLLFTEAEEVRSKCDEDEGSFRR